MDSQARSQVLLWTCFSLLACYVPSKAQDSQVSAHHQRVRVYFIAAEEMNWDYAPSGQNGAMGRPFDEFEKGYVLPGPIESEGSTRKRFIVNISTQSLRRSSRGCLMNSTWAFWGPFFEPRLGTQSGSSSRTKLPDHSACTRTVCCT